VLESSKLKAKPSTQKAMAYYAQYHNTSAQILGSRLIISYYYMSVSLKEIAYQSGDAFLPTTIKQFLSRYIIGDSRSLFYLNYWSIVHFLSGVVISFFTNHWMIALLIHTIWEIWQYSIGMTRWNKRGLIDTVVDTILCMLGYGLMKKYDSHKI